MGVTLSNQDGVLTAALTGDIDHHTARELRLAIDEAIERDKPGLLLLDFQGVDFMDSSGIGLIMGRYRLMRMYGGTLSVTGMSERIARVMRMAGLDKLGILRTESRSEGGTNTERND